MFCNWIRRKIKLGSRLSKRWNTSDPDRTQKLPDIRNLTFSNTFVTKLQLYFSRGSVVYINSEKIVTNLYLTEVCTVHYTLLYSYLLVKILLRIYYYNYIVYMFKPSLAVNPHWVGRVLSVYTKTTKDNHVQYTLLENIFQWLVMERKSTAIEICHVLSCGRKLAFLKSYFFADFSRSAVQVAFRIMSRG